MLDPVITAAVQSQADARSKLIEEYCERSLVDPEGRGVLVTEYWPSFKIIAELSKSVPYGRVHIYHNYGDHNG